MRFSIPSIMQGTLGSLVQQALGGLNSLVVTDWGFVYATSFQSNVTIAANTPQNVIAAASNTAGVRLLDAGIYSRTASIAWQRMSLVAKATAPATVIDGEVQLIGGTTGEGAAQVFSGPAKLNGRRIIASGLRLDFMIDDNEFGGIRHALYTAL